MTERVRCKTPGCARDILPSTAADTGGFCMPCVQAEARKKQEEYIRTHRREVDPFAGVDDPVEVIKIIHTPVPHDPLVRRLPCPDPIEIVYGSLKPGDQKRLVSYLLSQILTGVTDPTDQILLELAAFTATDLNDVLRFQAIEGDPWYSMPFRGADEETRDCLLKRVEVDGAERNHVLQALAWIGDEKVAERFAQWRRSPPTWRGELYVPPEQYAHEAGWELTPEGGRRNLYVASCHALLPVAGESADFAFTMGEVLDDACAWCGRALTVHFKLDRSDPRLKDIPWRAFTLMVANCPGCSCYGPVFGSSVEGELPRWAGQNRRPEYLPDNPADWDPLPVNPVRLSPTARPAHWAADQFLPTTFSQVGGMPTWIQDSAYPSCAGCNRTMVFVAQLSNSEFQKGMEGTYFAFVCPDCRLTAVNYQQT